MSRRPRVRAAATLLVAALLSVMPVPADAAGRCGRHPWCDTMLSPDARAHLLLHALTLDERITLLAGGSSNGHTGATAAIPRVGLPAVYFTDGPVGVRQQSQPATQMPIPLALAATFDPGMAHRYGATIAEEARDRGDDGILGPTVNIMRTPLGGRTFEAFGEDPYLAGQLSAPWVRGAQSRGVMAVVKHLAANNQEGVDPTGQTGKPDGTLGASQVGVGLLGTRYAENSVVDERTLHEIYLPAFESAVRAHAAAVMCAYNRLNGPWACENRGLLTSTLRRQLGFHGLVMSDWNLATHPGAAPQSLRAGLDLEMPNAEAYTPTLVRQALLTGQVTRAEIDRAVASLLRTLFAFGVFDRPAYRDQPELIDVSRHEDAARRVSESSITLLRNRGILPLSSTRLHSLAVIGPFADKVASAGAAGAVTPYRSVTPLAGIRHRAHGISVRYDDGSDPTHAAAVARAADAAVVVVGNYENEGADRQCLTLECPDVGPQDQLVEKIAAAQPHTIVVLETGGPVLTPWRRQVPALVEAWYPGEDGGDAIAHVLFGDTDPSGRLPVTFPAREQDQATHGDAAAYPGVAGDVVYKEGVLVGYRWFDAHRIRPAYPFGFGLSYTHFRYRDLRVTRSSSSTEAVTVAARVTNIGARTGTAVAQLYVGLPRPDPGVVEPPRQLRGFDKVTLAPGSSRRVRFVLTQRDLSYWNTATHGWSRAAGFVRVWIGSSSRHLPLSASVPQQSREESFR